MKKYRMTITEIDEDNKETVIFGSDGETFNRIAILAEVTEEGCCEILVNESIAGLARKIVTADKFCEAARMGISVKTMMDLQQAAGISGFEDALSDSIEGGDIQ